MMIPASSLRLLIEGLGALGTPSTTCAHLIGVHPDSLRGDGSISAAQALALVTFAIETTGPSFGVDAGFAIPPGRLGLVDHLCAAGPDVATALEDLARYFGLVATGVSLTWDGRSLVVSLPKVELPQQRLFAELTFAVVDQRMSSRSGRSLSAEITFPWVAPGYRERLEARWPGATFEAHDCRMTLEPELLRAPLATSDPTLRELLDGYAKRELVEQPALTTVADRVRDEIVAALPGRPPGAEDVARALGMSSRGLRRALSDQGTRFSDVRDAALLSVAARALEDPARTVSEVGWLLGYSEPSAFHRAFRRWTNTTPELFRQSGQFGL
ncbi:MAG: helix-turn-helix domain-containing protein [Deltaproteobacteria bacterium]|nr:helix-turn-helix domain-containing protein [Deltaproteobacteria bacterium]